MTKRNFDSLSVPSAALSVSALALVIEERLLAQLAERRERTEARIGKPPSSSTPAPPPPPTVIRSLLGTMHRSVGVDTHVLAALECVLERARVPADVLLQDALAALHFECPVYCRVVTALFVKCLPRCIVRMRYILTAHLVRHLRRLEPANVGSAGEDSFLLLVHAAVAVTDPRASTYVPAYYLFQTLEQLDSANLQLAAQAAQAMAHAAAAAVAHGGPPVPPPAQPLRHWLVDELFDRLRPQYELYRLCTAHDSVRGAVFGAMPFPSALVERGFVAYPQRISDASLPVARLHTAALRHAIETNASLPVLQTVVRLAPHIDGLPLAYDRTKRAFVHADASVRQAVHDRLRSLAIVDRIHDLAARASSRVATSSVSALDLSVPPPPTAPPFGTPAAMPTPAATSTATTTAATTPAVAAVPVAAAAAAVDPDSPSQYLMDDAELPVAPPPPPPFLSSAPPLAPVAPARAAVPAAAMSAAPCNSAYAVLKGRFGGWLHMAETAVTLCDAGLLSFGDLVTRMAAPVGVAGARFDCTAVWLLSQMMFHERVHKEVNDDQMKDLTVMRALEQLMATASHALAHTPLPPMDDERALRVSGMFLAFSRLTTVFEKPPQFLAELKRFEYYRAMAERYDEWWGRHAAQLQFWNLDNAQLFSVSIVSTMRSHIVVDAIREQSTKAVGWERAISAAVLALLSTRTRQRLMAAFSVDLDGSGANPPSFGAMETLSRIIVMTPSIDVLKDSDSIFKTLLRSAVHLTVPELQHLQLIAELFCERLLRHMARRNELSRLVATLSLGVRRLTADALPDANQPVTPKRQAFTRFMMQHALLCAAHASALVDQVGTPDMTALSHSTGRMFFLLYEAAWFYRPPIDVGQARLLASLRMAAARHTGWPVEDGGGDEPVVRRAHLSPDMREVSHEVSQWGALTPDQPQSSSILASRLAIAQSSALAGVAMRYGESKAPLDAVRLAMLTLGPIEIEEHTNRVVHFMLDRHLTVVHHRNTGNVPQAVAVAAQVLHRLAWLERVLPVEFVLQGLLERDDTDAFASRVLVRFWTLPGGAVDAYATFAQHMVNGQHDNDASLARAASAEFAHWHYSTFHERLRHVLLRRDDADGGTVFFTHQCSRLSLYVECTLRRLLGVGDAAGALETLRHVACMLRFHAFPTALALQLCAAVWTRVPAAAPEAFELLLRCARVAPLTAASMTDEALAHLMQQTADGGDFAAFQRRGTLDAAHARAIVARYAPLFDVAIPQAIDDRLPTGERFSLTGTMSTSLPTIAIGEDAFGATGADQILHNSDEFRTSGKPGRKHTRCDVPRLDELCNEPLPLQAFEELGGALQRAPLAAAIEVLVCGFGRTPAEIAGSLVDAAVDIGSQRLGAAEFAGAVLAQLPHVFCDAAIRAALDVVQAACAEPLPWHARATLLDDSRCALLDMMREQPAPSETTHRVTSSRLWLRALHARTLLHTLLRYIGMDVSVSALTCVAERCARASSAFEMYLLVRCVLLGAPRATMAARFALLVALARGLVAAAGPSSSQVDTDVLADEADEQMTGALVDIMHHLIAFAKPLQSGRKLDDADSAAMNGAVAALRKLLPDVPNAVTRRRLVDMMDAIEQYAA